MRSLLVVSLIAASLVTLLADAQGEATVRIVSPQPETTIHDNSGNLEVVVDVQPPMPGGGAYHLTILLDNQPAASGTRTHYAFTEVDRGAHTLQATVNTADGAVIVSSQPVTFYMWRASRLFPNRR